MAKTIDWEKRYLAALEALVAHSEGLKRKIVAFFDYYRSGVGERPKRGDWPDRLLNPSINGSDDLLRELRICAERFLPGELSPRIVKALRAFSESGTELVDTIEGYLMVESLNRSYACEVDLVKYLTRETSTPIEISKHADIVKHYVKTMKDSFYKNSDAIYIVEKELMEQPVSTRVFCERTDKLMNGIGKVGDGVGLIYKCIPEEYKADFEALVDISGYRLEEFHKVRALAVEHPDWKLFRLCKEAWMGGKGYPRVRSLNRFCTKHKDIIYG